MNFGEPDRIEMLPVNGKRRFRFRLYFPGRKQPVEFETSADGAMALLKGLLALQARHKLSIRRNPPSAGPPKLSIVTDE